MCRNLHLCIFLCAVRIELTRGVAQGKFLLLQSFTSRWLNPAMGGAFGRASAFLPGNQRGR